MAELSIIIVNWNCLHYTRQCLNSIADNRNGADWEVVVVDSASTREDPSPLATEFPWITLVKSEKNLGFAGANNLGVDSTTAAHLLFLNPDTMLRGNALAEMLAQLKSLPDAGAVGCKLLNGDGSIQTSCIQRFPRIWNQVLDVESLRLKWPHWKMWGIAPLFSGRSEPVPVEVISGACVMLPRDVFLAAGKFSCDYFMYAEDVELCHAVWALGKKCYYVGSAEVVHFGGGSTTRQSANQWSNIMQRKAIRRFCRKTRGSLYAALYQGAMGMAATARLLLLAIPVLLNSKDPNGPVAAFAKWSAILKWTLGLESQQSTAR